MPRILCFLHSFEPGGVERTALHLCSAWQRAGAEVAVMLGRNEGRLRGEAPDLGYLVPTPPRFSTAPIETLWMIVCLPGMIRRWRPDVLFCAGNSYTAVAVMMKLLFGSRCPPIVAKISNDLVRSDLPRLVRIFYRLWCRLQGRVLDHLVALSPEMRDEIIVIMRVDPRRVTIINDAVLEPLQQDALAQAGVRARTTRGAGRRFVAIGRLAPQKNFLLLIRAFARAAAPDDRLVIVGEGAERGQLERLIGALGLQDRVQLAGHCEQVEHWLACSDILLLTSRYEGLPAVVIEALAAGLPILATDCCASMRTLLGDGRFGALVSHDESTFADALAAIRPNQYDSAGAALFASRFNVEAAGKAYLGVYRQIGHHVPNIDYAIAPAWKERAVHPAEAVLWQEVDAA